MKNATIRKIILNALMFTLAVHLGGCMILIHNAVVSYFPTFEETERSWPPLAPNVGRVVVYWPRLPAQGISPSLVASGFGAVTVTIDSDKSKSTSVGDQTFVFVDLSLGTHSFEVKTGGLFGTRKSLQVDVPAAKITYLKIQTSQLGNDPPKVVDAAEARESLKKIHHNFKKPLPFLDQPKGAMRAM